MVCSQIFIAEAFHSSKTVRLEAMHNPLFRTLQATIAGSGASLALVLAGVAALDKGVIRAPESFATGLVWLALFPFCFLLAGAVYRRLVTPSLACVGELIPDGGVRASFERTSAVSKLPPVVFSVIAIAGFAVVIPNALGEITLRSDTSASPAVVLIAAVSSLWMASKALDTLYRYLSSGGAEA
jgi:hypothetical protein